jgi:pimeloyl-ACP methyl ester carboxylesterase
MNWWEEEATLLFCSLFDGVCEGLIGTLADADPSVDNMSRLDVFMSNFPAGSPYQDLVLFAQNTAKDGFHQFNYGERDNVKIYGSVEPPKIPLENFKVPVALIQGDTDRLADPTDVEWLNSQISSHVVFRKMYSLGHLSFTLAQDMSWFSEDVVDLMS